MKYAFEPSPVVSVPVAGTELLFPVRRIFCVGRNYAEHAREMGAVDQASGLEPPFFFMKPADALIAGAGELSVTYPPQTADLHHEVELVVALAGGGANLAARAANELIYGYAVGVDLTRRDMQARAKLKSHPWDMSKGFDQSAILGEIHLASQVGHPERGPIQLRVNGQLKQDGDLVAMMWRVPNIIANLSTLVRLAPGDLIYTGTPAGVGSLQVGDRILGEIVGVGQLRATIVA